MTVYAYFFTDFFFSSKHLVRHLSADTVVSFSHDIALVPTQQKLTYADFLSVSVK